MAIKICFFCKHCHYKAGFAYSELTWNSGEMWCDKEHWALYGDHLDLVDVGKELARAETCPDFSAAEGVLL